MFETQIKHLRLLKDHLSTISDLHGVSLILNWDRQTQMPPGGVKVRAEQLATINRLGHEMLASPDVSRLLDSLDAEDLDPADAALVRVARKDHERATRLPARLVEELARARSLSEPAWAEARALSDWAVFEPHLEHVLGLQREAAEHLGYENHPYEAMLDLYEPGARKARLDEMFEQLRDGMLPLLKKISGKLEEDRSAPLRGDFDERKQEAFGAAVISAFGYDWSRGRQDRAVHPFCVGINPGDVRITTRFDPQDLSLALFASFHESGHAIYEQGIDPSYTRTPLDRGASMGVHESQSRMWENLVGRSRPFWSFYYPKLQETFPETLGPVDPETFYKAINAVRPSEIRTTADELTYDLHIMLRFELESSLFDGSLKVAELPEAWNAGMEEYLGLVPEDDARGVLQDIHWSHGFFGYFPSYTVGNVLSAQIFGSAVEQRPEILKEMERGSFDTLRNWLRENIHRHGRSHEPDELVEKVTGRTLDTAPYLEYLNAKFGGLYDLS